MSLLGSVRYVQATDPGAVGTGWEWVNTATGVWSIRNATNDGWITLGNVNTTNLGLLARDGGVMTGVLTGAHGCAPLDVPGITGSLKLDGVETLRLTDVADLRLDLYYQMKGLLGQSLYTSLNGTTALRMNNLALGHNLYTLEGSVTLPQIPLPYYPDGTQATEAQVRDYGAFLVGLGEHNSPYMSVQNGYALFAATYGLEEAAPQMGMNPFASGSRVFIASGQVEQSVTSGGTHYTSNANQGIQAVTWILCTR